MGKQYRIRFSTEGDALMASVVLRQAGLQVAEQGPEVVVLGQLRRVWFTLRSWAGWSGQDISFEIMF